MQHLLESSVPPQTQASHVSLSQLEHEVTTWKIFLFLELKQIKGHWDWGQRFRKFMKIPLDVNKLVSHQNHVLSANGV